MPITVWTLSFMTKVLPTTPGSPPSARCQNSFPSSTTGAMPGRSSSSAKPRPRMGRTPRMSKNCQETTPVCTRIGSPRPRSVKYIECCSTTPRRLEAWAR